LCSTKLHDSRFSGISGMGFNGSMWFEIGSDGRYRCSESFLGILVVVLEFDGISMAVR
jgi:hypothetical protein